jgi:hypothetical protein
MFDARNIQNRETENMDKMQGYFRNIRYQAAHITQAAASVIYNGLIQLSFAFQA